jgi:hypothetical protein
MAIKAAKLYSLVIILDTKSTGSRKTNNTIALWCWAKSKKLSFLEI